MNITKHINSPGCDLATGWDGAYLDGPHSTGHEMRVIVKRCMYAPKEVRYDSTVDGSQHLSGTVAHPVDRHELGDVLPAIFATCRDAKSEYRETKP